MADKQVQTAIRLPDSIIKRMDKMADRLSKGSFPLTRSDVLRRALELGMTQLEQGEKRLGRRR